jgi:response regulator RpfG family c-di-GMP phosphodiesterase
MLRAAKELARIADPDALLEVLLARAIDLAHADTGSIMLVGDDGTMAIAVSRGLPDEVVAKARVAQGEGIAGWVLATGQPLVIEDLVEKAHGHRHGVRSAISVPLVDEDGVVGVLNVGARDFRARPDASVADALETLGRAGTVSLRTARAFDASRDMYFETLRAVARAVEVHSPVPPAAAERLIAVVTDLADACGLASSHVDALRVAALMHDVGMAGVGTSAPDWERPLTTVEWGLVKMHPVIAAHALAQVPSLHDVVPIVLHHHERYDGTGYVDGLAGDEIPLAARVFAVADAYVAMTSPRPYRLEMSPPEALQVIREQAGTQFDPQVVEALLQTAQKRDSWVKVWG